MQPAVEEFELVSLKDGIKSLRMLSNKEIFHPGIGPSAEANILHVEQQRLFERCAQAKRFVIWDVGLGAAANAVTAIEALKNLNTEIEIHSFDRSNAPLSFALENASALGYLEKYTDHIEQLKNQHYVEVQKNIHWHYYEGNFCETMMNPKIPAPDAVFYDPYSPKKNMEMWNLEHFQKLFLRLGSDSKYLLTNYSRSTVIRVTWLLAGFYVGVGSTIGTKAETSVASNSLDLLEFPLDRKWLERKKVSHSSMPLIGTDYREEPINEFYMNLLLQHPQFQ